MPVFVPTFIVSNIFILHFPVPFFFCLVSYFFPYLCLYIPISYFSFYSPLFSFLYSVLLLVSVFHLRFLFLLSYHLLPIIKSSSLSPIFSFLHHLWSFFYHFFTNLYILFFLIYFVQSFLLSFVFLSVFLLFSHMFSSFSVKFSSFF